MDAEQVQVSAVQIPNVFASRLPWEQCSCLLNCRTWLVPFMIKLPVFSLLFYFYYPATTPSLPFPTLPRNIALPTVAGTNPSLHLPSPEGFSRSGPASLAPRMSCFAHVRWQFQQIDEEAKPTNFPQNFVRSDSSYLAVALNTRGKVTADTSSVCAFFILQTTN